MALRNSGNDAFFRGGRRSPWYLVAFGMIGASISGVTFVSVPGMVIGQQMTYLQTCLGFIFGYLVVTFLLLPLYYRLPYTTIYSYLGLRLGRNSYLTGAWFFLISKLTGAAVRFYLACFLLHRFFLQDLGLPMWLVVIVMITMIWLYTRRGGIGTLVHTDVLQTAVMLLALIFVIIAVVQQLGMSPSEAITAISENSMSRIFVLDDWSSPQNFFKQFFSGIFIVIVMTGLDQDMMQKNLTCRSLRDAQKDMFTLGFTFVPVNLLFLSLGVLLVLLAQHQGIELPERSDELLPMFAATGKLGTMALTFFTIGIVASSFSSADSALTALTTSYCIDIRQQPENSSLRQKAHIVIAIIFIMAILFTDALGTSSVINAVYTLCSYTYGPLLGLFAFGITTKMKANERLVPYICVLSPILCFAIDNITQQLYGYRFGYEMLILNGALTFIGLAITRKN